jgi:hypothetical protein
VTDIEERFEEWCLLELMGHRKLAGKVTSVEVAGKGFLRLDVYGRPTPGEKPLLTQFVSPSSVYAMTPVTEITARRYAINHTPQPVTRWELPELEAGDDAAEIEIVEHCSVCDDRLEGDVEKDRGICENCLP